MQDPGNVCKMSNIALKYSTPDDLEGEPIDLALGENGNV
jgi:hypothetical protein